MGKQPEEHLTSAAQMPNQLLAKPLLRGWSHAAAAVAAAVVTVLLLLQTWNDPPRFAALLVFGMSMMALYIGSAVYHIGRWTERRRAVLRALDHANIFLLIAGTYTPVGVIVLSGWTRIAVLSIVWTAAALGIFGTLATLRMPRGVLVGLYIAMGWVAVIALPQLLTVLPWQATALLFTGGILYSLGGLVYALKRPNPLPHIFGFHEVFHLFTVAAGAAFVLVVWIWVLPFERL